MTAPRSRRWDIYCWVIDNYGDVGVCWRLARALVARGHGVRLFINDPAPLQWMATTEDRAAIATHAWPTDGPDATAAKNCGDVVIEAFGCQLPRSTEAAIAASAHTVWINLEYLTAEPYAAANHGLASPVMTGPAKGFTKWFFYPGFTPETGGLLGPSTDEIAPWPLPPDDRLQVGVFSYECPALANLHALANVARLHLYAAAGRSGEALKAQFGPSPARTDLTPMSQQAFDGFLIAMDLNIVRGEDSLVRALWAGHPFVWHIYPQTDGVHFEKLTAFLDWLQPPTPVRELHAVWNDPARADELPARWEAATTATCWHAWCETVSHARARLCAQPTLIERLEAFVATKS